LIFSYTICIIFCYAKDSLAGSGTAFKFYYNKVLRKIFYFFNKKAYFDDLYNLFLNSKIYKAGHSVYTLVDKGILEIFGPRGLGRFAFKVSKLIKRVYNSGPIAHLVYLMMLGVVILFVIAIILL
jgi:NADH:ubiquinone oxidoreductase subunit 5 (subunit L)/multisubunit Na+/H+ antiporter MnhA subunit